MPPQEVGDSHLLIQEQRYVIKCNCEMCVGVRIVRVEGDPFSDFHSQCDIKFLEVKNS